MVFSVVRNAQVSDALKVRIGVDETGAMVADMEEGSRTVTIQPNSTSTSITVSTEHDDQDWEPHSTVNATISASSTYTIKQGVGRAETLVKDGDFPEASAVLSLNPARVSEGEDSTLTITVTTTHDQDPHGPGGTLTLTPIGGTAAAEDYGSLSQSTFSISAADFVHVDVGSGSMAYRAVYTATVETADDSDSEPDETIVFQLGKGSSSEKISIVGSATSTVTIIANDASSDASLGRLNLSDGTLSPPFTATTTNYTASVPYAVEHVTLEHSKGDSSTEVTILDAGGNVLEDANVAPGFQVNLAVGSNVVKLKVTAEDGNAMQTYVVTITRSKPTVGILGVAKSVPEGGVIEFSVSRDATSTEAVDVIVEVTETNMLLAAGEIGQSAITIPSGTTTTSLTIAADTDDNVWEEHSTVTVSIVASSTYDIAGGQGNAQFQIEDDDFPEATVSLITSPNPVAEGETVTLTIVVRTNADEQPHRGGGTLTLAIAADSAQSSDYGSLSQSAFPIGEADFVPDAGSNTYVSGYLATIEVVEDSEVEKGESFDVSLSLSSDSPASLELGDPITQTVYIRDFSVGLVELHLSGVNLSPQFTSDTLNYTGSVPYQVVQTVVSATTTEASSPTPRISLNDVPVPDGRIPLSIGANQVTIEVMSEDSSETRTYVITVTREKPEVSISGSADQASEGAILGYTVSRSTSAPDTLDVLVRVVEDGDMVPAGSLGEGSRSVIIPAGSTSTSFVVETGEDDDVWDAHSTLSVALMESDLYLIKTGEAAAETLILDDDFPESIASMSVVPPSVIEGGSVALRVDVTTVRDEAPHADGGHLIVATANDSAIGGIDYVALTLGDGTLSFLKSDFLQLDKPGQTRYRASKLIGIETIEDDDQEGVERFVVILNLVTVGKATTSSQIVLDASSQMLAVAIEDGPDAELTSLILSEGTLIPPFGTSTRSYAAEVSYGVEQVTVAATTSRASASVTFHDGNDDPIADLDNTIDGHQVPLEVGKNTIRIKVLEADNTVLDTYTVAVTRVEPVVGIATTTSSVLEGDPVVFTVHRDFAPSEPLQVEVSVTETGEMVDYASQGKGDRSVTIASHATSANLTVNTKPDDDWEEHSIVSASIAARDTYAISAHSRKTDIQVTDDDFPAATATLAVAPNQVTEGEQVFALITVTTGLDQAPHSDTGNIQLAVVGVSATSGNDFTPPLIDLIAFAANDFDAVDVGGQTHYAATKRVAISTVDDGDYEGQEAFAIEIIPVTDGLSPTAPQIAFDPSESRREVIISDNDDAQTGGGEDDNNDPPDTGDSPSTATGGSGNRGGGGGSGRSTLNRDPSFEDGGETSRSIGENSPIGTRVGERVQATDRDGDRLTYSLTGEDRSSFEINESTGRLYTATSLDREADSRYYLTVAVSDRKGGTDSIRVTIVVTDVDEAPNVSGEGEVSLPEQDSGILATYEANDPENGDIRWTLSGADADAFDIEAGALAFRSAPDFENPTDANRDNSYELTVSASDGVHISTLDIVVTVTDLDESPSPTPTPSPTPIPSPLPTPIATFVPTATATARPTSTPSPVPTHTPAPQPTATATAAPVATATATPRPTYTPTPAPLPTMTPTPMPLLMDQETPRRVPLRIPLATHTPAASKLRVTDVTPTLIPTSSPTPLVILPTPSSTPSARPVLTDGGSVPAWLMLSITFWAILSTGVGVYIYLRHR